MTELQLTTLLQRFMDGATSIDEEARLADFFRSTADSARPSGMPEDDWRAYREMFAMFEPESAAGGAETDGLPVAERRISRRALAGWMAAAAAVALLVVAGLAWQRGSDASIPAADVGAAVALQPADVAGDSIAVQPQQTVAKDSVEHRAKKNAAKARRPYWQPRPPKVYVADKAAPNAGEPSAEADARKLEEAVKQADILLQAISAHQSAELELLQSQAMELFDGGCDSDADGDEGGER